MEMLNGGMFSTVTALKDMFPVHISKILSD